MENEKKELTQEKDARTTKKVRDLEGIMDSYE